MRCGSGAVLDDALYDVADALTAAPLPVAFWPPRRPASGKRSGRLEASLRLLLA